MVITSYDINSALAELSDRYTIVDTVIRPIRKQSPSAKELEAIEFLVDVHDYSYVSIC